MLRCTNRILPSLALVLLAAGVFHAEDGTRFNAASANVSGAGEAIKINVFNWSTDSIRDEFVAAWTLTAAAPQGRGGRGGGNARGGAAGRGGRGGAGTANAPAATTPPTTQGVAPDLPADPDLVDSPAPAARGGRGGRGGGGAAGTASQTPESSLAAAIQRAPTAGILWTSENVGYSIKYAYRLPQADGGERIILATDRRVGKWSNLWVPATGVTPSDYPFSIIELRFNSKGEGEGRGLVTGKVAIDDAAKTIALDTYAALPVMLKTVKRQPGN